MYLCIFFWLLSDSTCPSFRGFSGLAVTPQLFQREELIENKRIGSVLGSEGFLGEGCAGGRPYLGGPDGLPYADSVEQGTAGQACLQERIGKSICRVPM